jgi:hypothetical protein
MRLLARAWVFREMTGMKSARVLLWLLAHAASLLAATTPFPGSVRHPLSGVLYSVFVEEIHL